MHLGLCSLCAWGCVHCAFGVVFIVRLRLSSLCV